MHLSPAPSTTVSSELSDAELIQIAKRGVEEAFFELVHRYQDRLLTSMRRDVNCSESADDIVQDAFVRAFKNLDSFRSESSFYTWLYRIALNSRRYYLRNRHRTVSLENCGDPGGKDRLGESWIDSETDPGDQAEAREECEQVRAALARLDDQNRKILLLREFDGCDYRAISLALNLTLGTVRSRLSRAREQLRRELAAYWKAAPADGVTQNGDLPWVKPGLSLTA